MWVRHQCRIDYRSVSDVHVLIVGSDSIEDIKDRWLASVPVPAKGSTQWLLFRMADGDSATPMSPHPASRGPPAKSRQHPQSFHVSLDNIAPSRFATIAPSRFATRYYSSFTLCYLSEGLLRIPPAAVPSQWPASGGSGYRPSGRCRKDTGP